MHPQDPESVWDREGSEEILAEKRMDRARRAKPQKPEQNHNNGF